jgi:ammonia channel protein AmtB
MLGTMMLIFGWIGFNPGSALLLPVSSNQGFIAGHSAVTTVLSAAGGTISSLLINGFMTYRHTGEFDFDVYVAMNGWCVHCFNNVSMKSLLFDLPSPHFAVFFR